MSPASTVERPGARTRLAALLAYLGFAPFYSAGPAQDNDYADGHRRHALAMLLALLGVVLLYAVGFATVTIAIGISRSLYVDYHIESHVLGALRKVFLAWGVFWLFAMATALLGREAYLPVVWRLARRDGLIRCTARLWIGLYVGALLLAAFIAYAGTKVRQDPVPGKVYLLYEDAKVMPRWVFTLGNYRLARAAEDRFGPGQAVMLRLTRESLLRALREGTFIFLGSHGMKQGILMPDGFFEIQDVPERSVNPALQFVYMSGCDQGSGWREAFAPAEVLTYDRLTTVAEHVWWMWFDGPRVIRALK